MKIDKVKNFEVSLHVIHINSKQTLHHGLVLKAVHRVIKLNQNFIVKTDNIYKLLQKMLKLDLICQIINFVDHYQ